MNPERRPKLIIAGGGTGGHVLAGVAVADAWKKIHGPEAGVLFVGAKGGIEERLVPRAGYPLELLSLGSLNQVSFGQKIRTLFKLPFSLLKSLGLVIHEYPSAVLGVGGYASGPLVLMARLLSVLRWVPARIGVLEQNSVQGLTNRILSRMSHCVFVAFKGTRVAVPESRVTVTGNPVRPVMRPLPSASRDPFTIFVLGGSQGALGINSLVLNSLGCFRESGEKISWIHQTGEKDYQRVLEGHRAAGSRAQVEKFIHDMPSAYSQAALVVCRAGSSTLAELAAVGRAAILIPFPFAADNHQEGNARIFEKAGGALLLRQQEAKGDDLAHKICELLTAPHKLDQMERAIQTFYRPNAAQDIVRALTNA